MSETLEINGRNEGRLNSLQDDFWRGMCGVSRAQRVRNDEIRRRKEMGGSTVETTEYKRLIWYRHLQRMGESRWQTKLIIGWR
jgi:hypothetical protein